MKPSLGIIMLLWNCLFSFEEVPSKMSIQSVIGGGAINVGGGGPFKPRQLQTHHGFFTKCSNGSFNSSLPSILWPLSVRLPCRMSWAQFTHIYMCLVTLLFFSTQWQEVVQISAGPLKKKKKEGVGRGGVSEQSWVVVVEGVGGGGCDELHSKLNVHCEQQDWRDTSGVLRGGGRFWRRARGERNKRMMLALRAFVLLVLSWTCQGGSTDLPCCFLYTHTPHTSPFEKTADPHPVAENSGEWRRSGDVAFLSCAVNTSVRCEVALEVTALIISRVWGFRTEF